MDALSITFALIGLLGVGSQWLAVRLRMPAIVFMLAAGLLAGPVLGVLDPEAEFGDLLKPIVAVAVAIILFEGGLTLNFHELRQVGPAVRRLCTWGAGIGWAANTAVAYWVAGLSLTASAVFGGILVVTGPTVIMPLLRQARLAPKTAQTLRWEAIVNDPVGALLAVLAFEVAIAAQGDHLAEAAVHLGIGILAALAVGLGAGWGIAQAFRRGHVAEYMKAPVLFVTVLGVYASTDFLLHESGLLAVTVMGVFLANARLPAMEELRRFKEQVTVLLVSGVFVILAATLDLEEIATLDWRAFAFVGAVILAARPLTVMLSLVGTELSLREKSFIAWIAPRGVVAVAISGFFGQRLVEIGVEDGARLAPLAFAVVAATVVLHGFSLRPVARALGLTSTEPPGVMILGASGWTLGLAEALRETGTPVLIVDRAWHRLGPAREAGLPNWFGEILSESAEHALEMGQYEALIAATDNDDYNALVCTDFGPEFGRDRVFQLGRHEGREGIRDLPVTLGGRTLLASGADADMLALRLGRGWGFRVTRPGEGEPLEAHLAAIHEKAEAVAVIRERVARFVAQTGDIPVKAGDLLISFAPGAAKAGSSD